MGQTARAGGGSRWFRGSRGSTPRRHLKLAALALCFVLVACEPLPLLTAGNGTSTANEEQTAAPISATREPAQAAATTPAPGGRPHAGETAAQATSRPAATPIASPPTPTTAPFPTPAVLVLGSGQQTAAVGSFCGTFGVAATPPPATCTDAIGIPTPRQPLTAGAPLAGKVRLPVAEAPAEFWLTVLPVTDGMELSGGPSAYRWWPMASGALVNLPLQPEAPISVTLEPGTYVLHVFARWPALGQVHYGFLVTVQAPGRSAGNALLDVYPLRAGASWVYSATVHYKDGGRPVQWQGAITETVTAVTQRSGASVFDVRLAGHPLHTRSDETFYRYVALSDGLYRLSAPQDPADLIAAAGHGYEANEFLTWPLHAGAAFGSANGGNGWQVSGPETAAVSAGWYPGCYHITTQRAGASTAHWFCPGIGMARIEYRDPASGTEEDWELAAAPVGTPARAEVIR